MRKLKMTLTALVGLVFLASTQSALGAAPESEVSESVIQDVTPFQYQAGMTCTVESIQAFDDGTICPDMSLVGAKEFLVDTSCGKFAIRTSSEETRKVIYSQILAALLSGKEVAFFELDETTSCATDTSLEVTIAGSVSIVSED